MEALDTVDEAIVADRLAKRAELVEPQTGDFIRFSDGYGRIAYVWPDQAQVECPKFGRGSYHLNESGGCSMSGALDPGVKLKRLTLADETREGQVWVFHHGFAGAGRGRDFSADFRVWAYNGPIADAS